MHVSFEIFATCQLCPVSAANKQTELLTDQLTDRLTDWPTDQPTDRPHGM